MNESIVSSFLRESFLDTIEQLARVKKREENLRKALDELPIPPQEAVGFVLLRIGEITREQLTFRLSTCEREIALLTRHIAVIVGLHKTVGIPAPEAPP